MIDKPIAIDLMPFADMLGGAREFLRMWVASDGQVLGFVNPRPIGADPAGFGAALVDAVRHGADAYARATGISVADAEARIWQGIEAERAGHPSAAEDPYQADPDDADSPISYDKDMH